MESRRRLCARLFIQSCLAGFVCKLVSDDSGGREECTAAGVYACASVGGLFMFRFNDSSFQRMPICRMLNLLVHISFSFPFFFCLRLLLIITYHFCSPSRCCSAGSRERFYIADQHSTIAPRLNGIDFQSHVSPLC